MKPIQLSIIIPVYNEEKAVTKVINDIKDTVSKIPDIEYEIILINDGSTDNSLQIIKQIQGINVLEHSRNKGYGASLKTGIRHSQYEWIIIIDADGTYPVTAIPELIKHTDNYDQVIGSREKKGNAIPLERRHAKKFLNRFAGYIAGRKVPDLNSGLRIFKKDIVRAYWGLFPTRFSFTSTLTMVCLSHGHDTKFIPIDYYERTGESSIRALDFFNFLKLIFKLSLFFKPIKVFAPLSGLILMIPLILAIAYLFGFSTKFFDTTIIVLSATALQTLFFGLLAEIVIHNK
ncbi:glycosyltransferase family 2 protein [Candidatus Parcubacteria bacterium]|nr:glycosyltransferase family 2 protein [Candidatus Parcubacteria bacterium]